MLHSDHGIALHAMEGNWVSSRGEGQFSFFCSCCSGKRGYILKLQRGSSFKAGDCSAMSRLLSSYQGPFMNLLEAWQGNADATRGEVGDPGSLSSCHSDIGIPINFQQESGIVTF